MNSMDDAESAELRHRRMHLDAVWKPTDGWTSSSFIPTILGGAAVSILLLFLAGLVFNLFDQSRRLRYLAECDELTGLYCRRGFINLLESKKQAQAKCPMAIVYLDFRDDFVGKRPGSGHPLPAMRR